MAAFTGIAPEALLDLDLQIWGRLVDRCSKAQR